MSQHSDDKSSHVDPQPIAPGVLPTVPECVMPVIEEQLEVRKVKVNTGSVRVRKVVHEETRTVDTPLVHEEVSITRVPVNRVVPDKYPSRQEGDALVIPVFKEVITKHLMLVEEVHITTRRVTDQSTCDVNVKREEAVVERFDADTGTWKSDPAQ